MSQGICEAKHTKAEFLVSSFEDKTRIFQQLNKVKLPPKKGIQLADSRVPHLPIPAG